MAPGGQKPANMTDDEWDELQELRSKYGRQ
jgi:hypothetical protein